MKDPPEGELPESADGVPGPDGRRPSGEEERTPPSTEADMPEALIQARRAGKAARSPVAGTTAGGPASEGASDEELMVQVTNGRREACDELYERHSGRLRAFVHRFVGRRDVAEDLVQDIFLKIYRNPAAFDPRGRFITWVLAVARNACIDWLRIKRLPTVPLAPRDDSDDRGPDPAAIGPIPSDRAVLDELEGRLEGIIRSLSPKLREVFLLCALQGLSYEDAAAIIGCPVKTVSSRLSRARDQVFEAFHTDLGEGVKRHR